jgi:eukaryotic-like serine/threonine-protein kinase
MQCPSCKHQNSASALRCANCNAQLNEDETVAIPPGELGQATITQLTAAGTPHSGGAASGKDSLELGTQLGGRYEILKMLGEGGMGAVYKARDLEVDRVVALKVIRPEYANRPEILARFKQELVLAREITHRNVIRIFDLGQASGIRFITMEYVDGQDLYSLLRSGEPLSLERKVAIAREVCKAIEAAHEQGVVHRDLKPQNIMVDASGRVLVMDFGIARSMEDTGLTHTGALIGTPAFMSPEQAKGEKLDTRSDLFSFGVIFYEMLTGKAPYVAETAVGLLLKRVQERPVAPVELDQQVPQALSDIVLKCLVVDRDQRYQTAGEIVRDLEGWLGDPATFRTEVGVLAAPLSPTVLIDRRIGLSPDGKAIVTPAMKTMAESNTRKWVALTLTAAAVVVGAVYGAYHFYWSRPVGPMAPVSVVIADFNNHTGDPVFSGTLESTLKLALEGAKFISAYERTKMRDVGLAANPATLNESKAQ